MADPSRGVRLPFFLSKEDHELVLRHTGNEASSPQQLLQTPGVPRSCTTANGSYHKTVLD
jgi:hypothetical protein